MLSASSVPGWVRLGMRLLVGLIGCFVLAGVLAAPSLAAGAWRTTGSLNTARSFQTETTLQNGQVLVAGGFGLGPILDSAELYDPGTETWAPTGSLNTARGLDTATLLQNGDVLVAGGVGPSGYLTSAELYDPTSGSWTPTGSMNTARALQTATLLLNGEVLVVGGIGNAGLLNSVELYDPTTGKWTPTGSLTDARELHTATLLTQGAQSGQVLVTGGFGTSGFLDSTELYDPTSGTWTSTGALVNPVDAQTATLLTNGKVLIAGGFNGVVPVANAELWNPNSGKWSNTGFLNTARDSHTATLLPNGQVLAAGGGGAGGGTLASAELYTPGNGRWATTGSMNTVRSAFSSALLPNGNVLVTGGQDTNGEPLASAELFSLDTDLNLVMPADKTVNATSPAGAIVNYKPNVNDENTATTSLNCSPPSGSTFPVGDTTVTCTATDTDGDLNSPVQGTMLVHVLGAAAQVSALEAEVVGVGPGTSLADKLAAVEADLAANDTTGACGTLDAFIHEVRAEAGNSIPGALAGKLISAALRIERVIGC